MTVHMRTVNFTIDTEWERDKFGPSVVVETSGHRFLTGLGLRDDVHVFRDAHEPSVFYVLSLNINADYCGVEVYEAFDDGIHRIAEYFLQDWEVESVLGPRCFHLSPINIAKKIAYYALPN